MELIVQKPYQETEIFEASDFTTALQSIESFFASASLDATNFQVGSVGSDEFSGQFGDGVTVSSSTPAKIEDDSITNTYIAEGTLGSDDFADGLITNAKLFGIPVRARTFSITVSSLTSSFQDIGTFDLAPGRPFLVYLMPDTGDFDSVVTMSRAASVRTSTSLIVDIGLKQGSTELSYGRFDITHERSGTAINTGNPAVADVPPNIFTFFHDPSEASTYELRNDGDLGPTYFFLAKTNSSVTYTLEAKFSGDSAQTATLTNLRGYVLEL